MRREAIKRAARLNPFTLPAIAFTKRDTLPRDEVVYFAIEGNEIVYIGATCNLWQRWRRHHVKGRLNLEIVRIAWLQVEDDEQQYLERALIDRFKPRANGIPGRGKGRAK